MDLIYRFDPYAPLSARAIANPDAAVECLCCGNDRFVHICQQMQKRAIGERNDESIVIPSSPLAWGVPITPGTTLDQKPFVLFLGCSDARAPVEHIFDLAINEAFVIRVAGNVLGMECLGSINYAIRHFDSLKLVVILGHSGCGAVSAAVSTYLNPTSFGEVLANYSLRSLVDRIQLAVRHASRSLASVCCFPDTNHPKYRTALTETAVYLNAAITAFEVKREIESQGFNHLKVVYGVYDLGEMMVHSSTDHQLESRKHLAEPPNSPDQFIELANQLAEGIRKRDLLT